MENTVLVKTKLGIVEVPAEVIGEKPWHMIPALWTRLVELCTDWTHGEPVKPLTDMLIPDAMFRNMKLRVQKYLYTNNPTIVEQTISTNQDTQGMLKEAIAKLNTIDWEKMALFGLVTDDEQQQIINLLTYNQKQTLVELRSLAENMAGHVCKELDPNFEGDFATKLEFLKQRYKKIPEAILNAFHSIRKSGNEKAHGNITIKNSENYVLGNLLFFIQATEWFLNDYLGK